ncbi:MAG: twin-arginine translocase TatA/TatE family subunit [Gaiellaceae bacterium]
MPGNIGWQGALLIILVLLLVFGPKRLPEMGRSLGRGMREFKDSLSGKDDDDELEKAELTPTPTTTKASEEAASQPQSERVSS